MPSAAYKTYASLIKKLYEDSEGVPQHKRHQLKDKALNFLSTKYKGKERELYLKICKQYGETPRSLYNWEKQQVPRVPSRPIYPERGQYATPANRIDSNGSRRRGPTTGQREQVSPLSETFPEAGAPRGNFAADEARILERLHTIDSSLQNERSQRILAQNELQMKHDKVRRLQESLERDRVMHEEQLRSLERLAEENGGLDPRLQQTMAQLKLLLGNREEQLKLVYEMGAQSQIPKVGNRVVEPYPGTVEAVNGAMVRVKLDMGGTWEVLASRLKTECTVEESANVEAWVELTNTFDIFDVSGHGTLNQNQFQGFVRRILKNSGKRIDDLYVRVFFNKLDSAGTKKISKENIWFYIKQDLQEDPNSPIALIFKRCMERLVENAPTAKRTVEKQFQKIEKLEKTNDDLQKRYQDMCSQKRRYSNQVKDLMRYNQELEKAKSSAAPSETELGSMRSGMWPDQDEPHNHPRWEQNMRVKTIDGRTGIIHDYYPELKKVWIDYDDATYDSAYPVDQLIVPGQTPTHREYTADPTRQQQDYKQPPLPTSPPPALSQFSPRNLDRRDRESSPQRGGARPPATHKFGPPTSPEMQMNRSRANTEEDALSALPLQLDPKEPSADASAPLPPGPPPAQQVIFVDPAERATGDGRIRSCQFQSGDERGLGMQFTRTLITGTTEGGQAAARGVMPGWTVTSVDSYEVTKFSSKKLRKAIKLAEQAANGGGYNIEFQLPEKYEIGDRVKTLMEFKKSGRPEGSPGTVLEVIDGGYKLRIRWDDRKTQLLSALRKIERLPENETYRVNDKVEIDYGEGYKAATLKVISFVTDKLKYTYGVEYDEYLGKLCGADPGRMRKQLAVGDGVECDYGDGWKPAVVQQVNYEEGGTEYSYAVIYDEFPGKLLGVDTACIRRVPNSESQHAVENGDLDVSLELDLTGATGCDDPTSGEL